MQTFHDVVKTLLASIRALEARRERRQISPPRMPAVTLSTLFPYRCEPTTWGVVPVDEDPASGSAGNEIDAGRQ